MSPRLGRPSAEGQALRCIRHEIEDLKCDGSTVPPVVGIRETLLLRRKR